MYNEVNSDNDFIFKLEQERIVPRIKIGGKAMPKALCIVAMTIFLLIFVVFLLDVIAGIPFARGNMLMDMGFIVCSLGLGVLSFFCLRQQK